MEYADNVRARMVRRMVGPSAVSASQLATESGIAQPTLSRWLREAATVRVMPTTKPPSRPDVIPPPSVPRRPQDWTALERASMVVEANGLSDDKLGELLRARGLHREVLAQWHEALEAALSQPGRTRPSSDSKRIRDLERELVRKDKALAETAALLVLKKKMDLLWAAGDDDTRKRSGK